MYGLQLFKRSYKCVFTRSSTSEPRKDKASVGSTPLSARAHFLHGTAILNKLKTDEQEGLTEQDVVLRLDEYGENLFDDFGGVSALQVLLRQIGTFIVLNHSFRLE